MLAKVQYGQLLQKSTHVFTVHHRRTYVLTLRSTSGDRTFAAAAPRLWNSLPYNLTCTMISLVSHFRHFFG